MESRWLKRTVLIGLGGTGKGALLNAKKKFIETFGEIPPLVKFLLIDTTSAHTDTLKATTPDGTSKDVKLEPSEVLFIEARGASLLPQVHSEIRQWFPPKAALKANILSGAGQIRCLGRLALFANARIVYDSLLDLLAQARNYQNERPSSRLQHVYKAYSSHLTVCVTGSLAGGTGSGTFLDIALILRDILPDEDQLFGYLLLPDVYINRPGTQNVEANAYGALVELDHHMSLQGSRSYSFGGSSIKVDKKPFDMVFLVNNQNRREKAFTRIEELTELLGLGIFLVSGPLGKEQADVFDNIVMQLSEQQGSFHGKSAHYASFGVSELVFDPSRIDLQQSIWRATAVRNDLLARGGPINVSRFEIELQRLQDLPLIPDPNTSISASAIEQSAQAHQEGTRLLAAQTIDQQWFDGIDILIKTQLHEAFEQRQGLTDAVDWLQKLHDLVGASLQDYQDSLNTATDGKKASLEDIMARSARKSLWETIQSWFGIKPRIDQDSIDQLAQAVTYLAHQTALQDALKKLKSRIEEHQHNIERAVNQVGNWSDHFIEEQKAALVQLRRIRDRDSHPFTLTLPPPHINDEAATIQSVRDHIDRLRSDGLETFLDNISGSMDQLCRGTHQTTDLRSWLRGILSHSEGDKLSATDSETLEATRNTLEELDALSAPAWNYHDAWVSDPRVGRREQVHILGVDSTDSDDPHPLIDERIQGIFAGNIHAKQKLKVVGTGNATRVYYYKIEASIPAFALRRIEMYREKYQQLSESRSFHLHRDWEKDLPDLLPSPSTEKAYEVWTKARLFGLIRDQPDYAYQTDRDGYTHWRSLGSSAQVAFEGFHRDFFGYMELEARVAEGEFAINNSNRSVALLERVEEALGNRQNLLEEASPDDANHKIFKKEARVLENWARALRNYRPESNADRFPQFNPGS